jgi:enamine deaminase RidA (YjgF/YER057c/UK114 family)
MADTKQAWDEVADRFASLGLKLKLHFEETAAAARPDEDAVKEALAALRESLDKAFSSVGNAVKDPSVKDDVVDVARSLGDALATTFSKVSDDLRATFRSKDKEPSEEA